MRRIDADELIKEVNKNKELFENEREYLEGLLLNAPTIPAEVVPVTITTNERKIEGFLYNNLLLVPCMSTQTAERFGIVWEERKVGE